MASGSFIQETKPAPSTEHGTLSTQCRSVKTVHADIFKQR